MTYILFQYPPNSVMRFCSSLSSFCGGSIHIFQETNCVCDSFRPLPFRQPHFIFHGRPSAHCLFVCPRGRNGYRKKSQHKKLTLENKFLPPPLLPGLEPATFRSRVRSSTTELPPPPPSPPLLILGKNPLPRGEIEPASEVHWNRRSNN